jgi:hypothetical protein
MISVNGFYLSRARITSPNVRLKAMTLTPTMPSAARQPVRVGWRPVAPRSNLHRKLA